MLIERWYAIVIGERPKSSPYFKIGNDWTPRIYETKRAAQTEAKKMKSYGNTSFIKVVAVRICEV